MWCKGDTGVVRKLTQRGFLTASQAPVVPTRACHCMGRGRDAPRAWHCETAGARPTAEAPDGALLRKQNCRVRRERFPSAMRHLINGNKWVLRIARLSLNSKYSVKEYLARVWEIYLPGARMQGRWQPSLRL